ncbi:uncharacterized protein LOC132262328 [Phlebotomus argentipes]|uniref:uncharacterized protein LOC132262328 n=1 Tax=Phlebotomus argentipes TaxID=94469 RepID=UPI0028936CE5|nr:uncharacterized protein LOC132262328 [Phlebotomus argentipes]
MGKSSSKLQIPNNPMEQQIYRKNQMRKRQRDEEKQKAKTEKKRKKELKKNAKKKKKEKKNDDKLKDLKSPNPPVILPDKRIDSTSNGDYQDSDHVRIMQDQLKLDSETFVLNQILLSIQFLGNSEGELWNSRVATRKLENAKTVELSQHSKSALMPDELSDAVDQRIIYVPRHGQQKKIYSRLNTRTMYIVHDNIEISYPGVTSPYSLITDAPIYKLELDEAKGNEVKQPPRHPGFVRLKFSETVGRIKAPIKHEIVFPAKSLTSSESDSDMEESDMSMDGSLKVRRDTYQLMNRKIPRDSFLALPTKSFVNGIAGSPSNTPSASTSPPSSEYDYAYITALHTHRPLCTMRSSSLSDVPLSTISLPDSCITNVEVALKHPDPPRYMDDKRSSGSTEIEEEDPYDMRQYLNSKAFMGYFIHMFQDQLATNLKISHQQLSKATWKGAVIYSEMGEYDWEIVPAIPCPWPPEALEWRNRLRAIKENPMNRNRTTWPTEETINHIIGMDCHIIPIGYMPKVGQNPQRELEWKLVFPNAERYLEYSLSNTQVKIYMMTKILIKCYVEPHIDKNLNMFTTEHLRAHLFWHCENTPLWPDVSLGQILMDFLKSLLNRIKTQRLPDYFIPRRNLLENIPQKILVELHKRIFRITENPVMYIIRAMRNVRFSKDFYPKFNFKKLYKCLIVDNPVVILMKSESPHEIRRNPKKFEFHQQLMEAAKKSTGEGDSDVENSDDNGVVHGHMEEYYKKINSDPDKRRRTKQVKFEQKRTLENIERSKRRQSTETIDIDFMIQRNMMAIRRNVVLKVFISHYIQMALSSANFRSLNQGTMYLKHADRLCKLFYVDGYEWDGEEYSYKIASMRIKIEHTSAQDDQDRPALPRRESFLDPPRKNRVRKSIAHQKSITEDPDKEPYNNVSSIPISPTAFDHFDDSRLSFCAINPKTNGHSHDVTIVDVHAFHNGHVEAHGSLSNGTSTKSREIRNTFTTNGYDEITRLSEESSDDDTRQTNTNLAAILGNL